MKATAETHLTSHQLAQRWGLNPNTPANWRRQGRGPKYIKLIPGNICSKVRYDLADVIEYERKNKIQPKEPK